MITALCCRKSAGTLTSWCGTKNDRIMKIPTTAVMNSGSSRFIGLLLGRHPAREAVDVHGLEDAADYYGRDRHDLEQVAALEAPDQLGIAREIGARGVQLLPDQRVIARHHEERE